MNEFAPYVVQASLHTMKLMVSACQRQYRWRISTHATPGTLGDAKRKHGRQSIVDRVQCLLTVPEVAQLEAIADRPDPVSWTHPLLKSITGYVEDLDIPAEPGLLGYFKASFSFSEAFDRAAQQNNAPRKMSAPSAQAKAAALYGDWVADLDDLDDIPATANGNAFNGAVGDVDSAFTDIDDAFDSITDPTGDGTWRDLSRALDGFTEAADTFASAAREIEDSLGAAAHAIETGPLMIQELVANTVDDLKDAAGTVASFVTTSPSDLFSMMVDAGIAITEDSIANLMADNGIADPMNIPAGSIVAIPVIV